MAMRPRDWIRIDEVLSAMLGVALILLLVSLARAHRVQVDASDSGSATLTEQTLAQLDAADRAGAPIQITAFSRGPHPDAEARDRRMQDLLETLDHHSDAVRVQWVDFDGERQVASRLGVTQYGTIVVQRDQGRVDLLERDLFVFRPGEVPRFAAEEQIRGAIARLIEGRARVAYFLSGHGELSIFDRGMGELRLAAEALAGQGWKAHSLDLVDAGLAVPDDASLVVMAGPVGPLGEAESEALRGYLVGGGALLVALDPVGRTPLLVEQLGVLSPEGVLRDPVYQYPLEERPLLQWAGHPATEALAEKQQRVVMDHIRPLVPSGVSGSVMSPILGTSPSGWIERGSELPSRFDPDVDLRQQGVAVAAVQLGPDHLWAPPGLRRVVVTGDRDWLTDGVMSDAPGNGAFLQAVAHWLASGTEAPAATAPKVRMLFVAPDILVRVRMLVLGVLPGLWLLVGLGVHRWRR